MKTSVSVVCYKYKVLANGESPLMLRISKDGRHEILSFDTDQCQQASIHY